MGFLAGLVALISQNDVFSTRHATGALWNLVVDNHVAKLFLVNDESFCKKLVELFSHSDIQVPLAIASALERALVLRRHRCQSMRSALPAKCAAKTFK
jgi:hypothetical protein